MPTRLTPYLNFRDNAREAMTFYHDVFGGELSFTTYSDLQASNDPADADKIMHGDLQGANGLSMMGADMPSRMEYTTGTDFSMSLSGDDDAELRGYWDKLAAGGTVTEPLVAAPWGDVFGMLVDRFGITWLVNIAGTPQE